MCRTKEVENGGKKGFLKSSQRAPLEFGKSGLERGLREAATVGELGTAGILHGSAAVEEVEAQAGTARLRAGGCAHDARKPFPFEAARREIRRLENSIFVESKFPFQLSRIQIYALKKCKQEYRDLFFNAIDVLTGKLEFEL